MLANVLTGHPSCWFYSDRAGEYSFSETATVLFYGLSVVMFMRQSLRRRSPELALLAVASLWLMLEESNYGQGVLGCRILELLCR